jgi:hypothetical protein
MHTPEIASQPKARILHDKGMSRRLRAMAHETIAIIESAAPACTAFTRAWPDGAN